MLYEFLMLYIFMLIFSSMLYHFALFVVWVEQRVHRSSSVIFKKALEVVWCNKFFCRKFLFSSFRLVLLLLLFHINSSRQKRQIQNSREWKKFQVHPLNEIHLNSHSYQALPMKKKTTIDINSRDAHIFPSERDYYSFIYPFLLFVDFFFFCKWYISS